MKRTSSTPVRIGLVLSLLIIAFLIPAVAMAAPPSPLQPASEQAAETSTLFLTTLAIAAVIFVLVEGLLIFAVFRYRREYDDDMPEQIHGNAKLEVMWTVVPALIMVFLFVLTLRTMQAQRAIPDDALTIHVTGNQWYWQTEYDTGVRLTNEVVVPVGVPVRIELTSNDVIHSFWVPQLGGKQDAIPGHATVTWFEVTEPGTYLGQCAEYCGKDHYAMLFDVRAMPEDEFDAWMTEAIASVGEAVGTEVPAVIVPGDPAAGEVKYTELCQSCHSLTGEKIVGPSFLGLSQRAGGRVPGQSAEEYLATSILLPCDYLAPGFPQCQMPQNFGEQLSEEDLFNLIAFLLEQ